MTRLFSEHPAGIAVIDADGAIGWLNPGFAKLFAPRFGDLSGSEFITVLAALGATPAAVDAVRGLIDGSRHGLYEAAVAGPGGQARWLCFSAAPGAPEAAGTTLVCQDVTRYRDTAPRPGPWPPAKAPDEAGPFEPGKIEAADAIEEELRDPARILLAEDNRSNRLLALAILQNAGYRVDSAVSGIEVLRALRRNTYDLVLMDLRMPAMDGLRATAEIRGLAGPHSRVPIVAITAHAMRGVREACLAAGMDDYLAKPFTAAALLDITACWLRRAVSGFKAPGSLVFLIGAGATAGPGASRDRPPPQNSPGRSMGTPMARLREAIDQGDLDALQRAAVRLGAAPGAEPD